MGCCKITSCLGTKTARSFNPSASRRWKLRIGGNTNVRLSMNRREFHLATFKSGQIGQSPETGSNYHLHSYQQPVACPTWGEVGANGRIKRAIPFTSDIRRSRLKDLQIITIEISCLKRLPPLLIMTYSLNV